MKKLLEQVKPVLWIGIGLLFVFFLSACRPVGEGLPSPKVEANETIEATVSPLPQLEETTPPAAEEDRAEPIFYLVVEGDTLSDIAARFNLLPETLLWANYTELFDNPDYLLPGMELLILPTDGVYHQVGGSDTLLSVAAFFGVEASAIIERPGNALDAQNTTVQAGQWLMVPGGQRLSRWRQMPNIPRQSAALSAEEFGSGVCEDNYTDGLVGDGDYAWPLDDVAIGAEGFASWHSGVDLLVENGESVLAADDGIIVFAGWSNLGYGYLAMIDHGNGDFSLYSGLSALIAACGHEVRQGDLIAEAGHTGHPSGPILHFEIRRGEEFLDPFALIPQP